MVEVDPTWIVAVYGAGLSTVLLIWTLIKYYLENIPRLKITVTAGFGQTALGATPPLFYLDIANIGKRPVTISSAGLYLGGHMNLNFTNQQDGLPRKIEEGENHLIYREIDELKNDLKEQAPNHKPEYAFVKDQTGKEYKSENFKKNPLTKGLFRI